MSTFTNLLFHVVYSTKYRKPIIHFDWQNDLYGYIGGVIRNKKGTLPEIGGIEDHIHLLARFSSTIAASDMLRLIEANSSKEINERDDVKCRFQWQPGFAAFSVGESQVETVRRYICNQRDHHDRVSFADELLTLLQEYNIAFDPRYVFEEEVIA